MNTFYYLLSALFYITINDLLNIFVFPLENDIPLQNYEIVKSLTNFKLTIFTAFFILLIIKHNHHKLIENIYIAIIYIKYASLFYFHNNFNQKEEYIKRVLMWLFTTPAMLSMLAKVNNLDFNDLKPYYHILPTALHLISIPYMNHIYYKYFYIYAFLCQTYFIYNLNRLSHYKYIRIFIAIWLMFGTINSLLLSNIIDHNTSVLYYVLSDLIAKFITMSIIYDLEEYRIELGNQMDLQSFHLVTNMLTTIHKYKEENQISKECNNVINYLSETIKSIIPRNKNNVAKIELLKKILPYDLDDKYLLTNINRYQKHEDICILFTDIVNYSEFSNKLSESVLYELLNNIYTQFDIRLRKYKSLQKIETIGDTYMIVGDLTKHYNKRDYVNEMISMAFDLIQIANSIVLPNKEFLNIRVGIHIGDVVIGILGIDIPRLCVIGNNVNFTSRLESSSEKNKVHISNEIYEVIKDNEAYDFEKRININLKNIGVYDTYFVTLSSLFKEGNARAEQSRAEL